MKLYIGIELPDEVKDTLFNVQVSLKQLDVAWLLKEEIDCNNISFEVVSLLTGIPVKRVERIYYNDLPKEDEMVSILEWVEKQNE